MNKNSSIQQFIKSLAKREGVPEAKIRNIIVESFRKSYCQGENQEADLHFEFDHELVVYRRYQIVEKILNPAKEISPENPLFKKGIKENNNLLFPLDTKDFSFSLTQEIRNQLHQNLGEVNWEKQHDLFKSLQGEIVKGSIRNIQSDHYLVDLKGGAVGYWAKQEATLFKQLPWLGQNLYFLVKEVKKKTESGQPQILLSRSDDLLLIKILEREVLEIKEKVVVIRHIVRLPGILSRVVVENKKWGVDPVGACIGKGAERIKIISQMIYPERIDIIPWTGNKTELLFNLLFLSRSGTKSNQISLLEKGDNWEIITPHEFYCEEVLLEKIGEIFDKKIQVRVEKNGERRENKGKMVKEVSNYKNVELQILGDSEE